MCNLDTGIVTLMFMQLLFDFGGVSDQIQLLDLFVLAQRHNGAGNEIRRAKVTAHRVEGDLHQAETLRILVPKCKMKIVARLVCKPGWGVRRPQGAQLRFTSLPASKPAALGNSRTMGRQYARGRCSRIADTY